MNQATAWHHVHMSKLYRSKHVFDNTGGHSDGQNGASVADSADKLLINQRKFAEILKGCQ